MSGAQCGLRSGATLQVPGDCWVAQLAHQESHSLATASDLPRATKPEELVSFRLADPPERSSPRVPLPKRQKPQTGHETKGQVISGQTVQTESAPKGVSEGISLGQGRAVPARSQQGPSSPGGSMLLLF